MRQNSYVNAWIKEMADMTRPDKIVWIDGSDEQAEGLRAEACSTGELIKLNEELLPGCYLHRSAVNDVARVEGRTFICTPTKEEAGNINNWMEPSECYAKLKEIYKGSMAGRTMYVIPYSMGVPGSPFSKIGIELTDSIYVVLSMLIMTRVGDKVMEVLGDSPDFVKGLHAKADLDEEKRYICHFPQDNTIWSVNSGYGGNVLLGKKCFALRIASYLGRKEGWMAEHMLILGIRLATVSLKKILTRPLVYAISFSKMVVYPLFCYALVYFLPLSFPFKASMLILSSVPCASVILNLAELHRSETELAANCVLVSTLMCFLTIPVLTLLL